MTCFPDCGIVNFQTLKTKKQLSNEFILLLLPNIAKTLHGNYAIY